MAVCMRSMSSKLWGFKALMLIAVHWDYFIKLKVYHVFFLADTCCRYLFLVYATSINLSYLDLQFQIVYSR